MKGSDFITLAGRLAVTAAAEEATYRTAVSRAYYGAFHIARSFLSDVGFQPIGNANVHAFVRQYLNGSGHPDACHAAAELIDLQSARNRADYDLDDRQVGTRGYAIVSVERAHRVASALGSCRDEHARELIRQGITEYEQRIRPR